MLHVQNRSSILEAHNWRFTKDPQDSQNPETLELTLGVVP
jgi:hypothetical protein